MAQDIVNHDGTVAGTQKLGTITVNTGARGSRTCARQSTDEQTMTISGVLDTKYDTRFDNPRYYSGDTAN